MSRVKYQHYVPRFYLEGFQNQALKLWCYDKVTGKSFQQSPDSLGGERLFYDVPDVDKDTGIAQFLEKWFVPLETEAARALKSWLDQLSSSAPFTPGKDDVKVMAEFIAVQELRTPNARQTSVAITELALKISFFNYLGQTVPEVAAKIENPIEEMNVTLPRDRWGHAHAATLIDVGLIQQMSEKLLNHIWVFLRNNTRQTNYTSDYPIVRHAHAKHPILKMRGLGSRGVQIVYPLSLNILERTHWKQFERFDRNVAPLEITAENVLFDNSCQVGESRRFVYCRENDFDLAHDLCDKCPEYRNRDRPALAWERGDKTPPAPPAIPGK